MALEPTTLKEFNLWKPDFSFTSGFGLLRLKESRAQHVEDAEGTLRRRLNEARRRYELAGAALRRAIEDLSRSKATGADVCRAAEERSFWRAAYQDALSAFAAALGIIVRPPRRPAASEEPAGRGIADRRNSGAA